MEENSKNIENKKSTTTDSITSSSDTFDTWTLIPPDIPDKTLQTSPVECFHSEQAVSLEDTPSSGVECLEKDDLNLRSHDNEHDGDISDGISIISDSESAGRGSPHLTLHLPETRFETPKKDECTSDEDTNNNNDVDVDSLKENPGYVPLTPPNTPERLDFGPMQQIERSTNTRDLVAEAEVQPARRVRIPLIIYLAVAVGIIAIVGRLKISLVVKDSPPISDELPPILRRLEHLESRNTFLHNIVDKLIDRINFLSTDGSSSTLPPKKDTENINIKDHDQIYDEELEKIMNFWSNEKQTTQHTNREKKPYKLPDFCYKKQNDKVIQMKNEQLCNLIIQKIAENDFKDKERRNLDENNMNSESDPSANLKDHQKPKTNDYVNQKYEKEKNYEKVQHPEKCHNKEHKKNNNINNRKDNNQQDDFSKQNKNEKYLKNDTKSYKDEKHNNWNENGKYDKKFDNGHKNYADSSEEYKENKHDNDDKKDSREYKYKKWDKEQKREKQQKDTIKYNDKKHNEDEDSSKESPERKEKKKDEDYKQKSNWNNNNNNNKYEDHSKEDDKDEFDKNHKQKKINNGKRNNKDRTFDNKRQKQNGDVDSVDYDDWQEKRMKYRESARKNAEGKIDDKNWYINRGKARETARDYEKPEGKRRRK